MKHSVKFVSLLAISTLVLSVLAGCASAASTTAPAATTEAPAAATAVASEAATTASGPVTEVTFWADWGGDRQPAVEQMVSDFNASHPNIHVTYVYVEDPVTKFLTASTSGQAPDVMIWDRNGTALYAPKGVLEPLDDYMAKDGISADTFYAEALREMTYDGKVYGLPMYYEAAILDGANAWQCFRYVTWPSLRNTTFFITTVTLINAFQLFDQAYVMTQGGPGQATLTSVYYIYQMGFQQLQMGYASAMRTSTWPGCGRWR